MDCKKICIIHLNQIGDLVFSLPLLKALREQFPGASIHSVIKPYLRELLEPSPYVNVIIERRQGLGEKVKLLKALRHNSYDLLISLAHSEECLLLAALSKARIKAGFSHFPWDTALDVKESIDGHNSWKNNAKLLKRLDIAFIKNDYVGLITVDGKIDDFSLPASFVVVSPGASRRRLTKTWQEDKFAQLLLALNKEYGLTPVLVGGADNRETNSAITNSIRQHARDHDIDVVDFSGRIGLYDLCRVIRHARLFVGIDSGVMHLASSLDVPVVGLFGPSDPFYVGPHNSRSAVVRDEHLACAPCYLKPCDHTTCMKNITVDQVMGACRKLLDESGSP